MSDFLNASIAMGLIRWGCCMFKAKTSRIGLPRRSWDQAHVENATNAIYRHETVAEGGRIRASLRELRDVGLEQKID